MMYEGSPENWTVNGELASFDEINRLEVLASNILVGYPAEIYRRYGYTTQKGSILMFSTQINETESELGSIARAVVAKNSCDNVKLELDCGYNNDPSCLNIASDQEFGEITTILQDLLESIKLHPTDAFVIGHLQAIVFCAMNAIPQKFIGDLSNLDANQTSRHFGDIIRSQVNKNTSSLTRSRIWGLPLKDDGYLKVASNEIVGNISPEDDPLELPVLLVEYEDTPHKVTYSYSKYLDGEIVLHTITDSDPAAANLGPDPLIDQQVAEFSRQLGFDVPGKHDVSLLIDKLSAVSLIDY